MKPSGSGDRLYELLPAVYRIRDAERGEPLRALLGILEEQLEVLERDIAGLYDDWFIETCEEWVVPYIGDLLGVRLLHDIESAGVFSQRALVANTLSLRRRKGTLLAIEELARDVTGWRSRAVAFFELLGWNQNLDHLRFDPAARPDPESPGPLDPPAVDRVGTVNLRNVDALDRIDGPFDVVAHTADVRPLGQDEGLHNIRNVGLFLWRLESYPVVRATPRRSATYADGFHFSPLGNPAPLFTNPARKPDEKGLARETHVPDPIRPMAFFEMPEVYYGSESDKSLAIYRRPDSTSPFELVPLAAILCKDLSGWSPPPAGKVAVDVERGRFAFAPGEAPADDGDVRATYHYGFSADLGGGPYDRRITLEKADGDDWQVTVSEVEPDPPPPHWRETLAGAVDDWDPAKNPRAVITIADNRNYEEELSLALGAGQHLILQADDRNRPTVRFLDGSGNSGLLTVTGGNGAEAALTLSGLQIEGGLRVEAKSLGKLEVRHSTLVPGHALDEEGRPVVPAAPSLDVAPDNAELEVVIERSISGALRLPAEMAGLTVRDAILDRPEDEADPGAPRVALAADAAGAEPGPPTTLERVTVFGEVRVETLALASEAIFSHRVIARRRQQGCIRYSYVDDLVSITPPRFRCQPDLALVRRRDNLGVQSLGAAEAARLRARLRPDFASARYGQPAYAQLGWAVAEEIRDGSEDGAEMGVYEHLKQPQREANLRVRLEEYLPYGLTAGWIHVT